MKKRGFLNWKSVVIAAFGGILTGTTAGIIQRFAPPDWSVISLLPGFLFGVMLPLVNRRFYRNFWATLVGFTVVATSVYPMMVVFTGKFFGVEVVSEAVGRFPFMTGILPSVVGGGLLFLTYTTFLGKKSKKMGWVFLGVMVVVGAVFFPLMQWTGSFIASYALWQATVAGFLTCLHHLDEKKTN